MSEKEQLEQQEVEETVAAQSGTVEMSDIYQTQTSHDIYQTPDVHEEEKGGLFSGQNSETNDVSQTNPYQNNSYPNNPYSNNAYQSNPYQNNTYQGNPYQNNAYQSNPDAGQNLNYNAGYQNNNPYNSNDNSNGGSNGYGNNDTYGNNNAYGSNNAYGNNNAYGSNNTYGNNNAYGNHNANSNNTYANNAPYGNSNVYGNNGYYNPYSPYAVPQQKKRTGLIVGIVIAVVLLFFIALFGVLYQLFKLVSEQEETRAESYDEIWDEYEDRYEDNYGYDDYDDTYDYDDDYDYDDNDDAYYDNDSPYYTLHDDVKYNLSYSIEWGNYEYDSELDNVSITVDYPIIKGNNVANLDKMNEVIEEETTFFTEYFEENYKEYLDENGYFEVYATGYVTYMSEEVMSVVFSEEVYTDYFNSVSLYCINIDMENGVVLDNQDILKIDDEFSIDFRVRSEEQNGSIDALDAMSDQEITQHLSDSNLIVFYTPQGMEIGLNHDEGWVTVTYSDYEKYLNIF